MVTLLRWLVLRTLWPAVETVGRALAHPDDVDERARHAWGGAQGDVNGRLTPPASGGTSACDPSSAPLRTREDAGFDASAVLLSWPSPDADDEPPDQPSGFHFPHTWEQQS